MTDTIESLRAERDAWKEKLKEVKDVLQPFVDITIRLPPKWPDITLATHALFTVGELRRVRSFYDSLESGE